ncbi:MAG: hypothetical protein ACI9F9_002120 [Candidatus Paceibacteria bacterium]|jgi:hypothetical protein
MRCIALLIGLSLTLVSCASSPPVGEVERAWPLVYSQDFEVESDLEGYAFTDPACWKWSAEGGRGSLELTGASQYSPIFRSPTSIALIPGLLFADFDLEVELLQTGRNYGHRDMCLFLGFTSPECYDYVHLATSPDANAHNIFRVDGAPRRPLSDVAEQGIDWGEGAWHRVRIERRSVSGSIEVFWDDEPLPILQALDQGFDWGRIGFGSFDDSGRVSGVRVWALSTKPVVDAQPFERAATQ